MNTWYIYLEHDSHVPPCNETLDGGTHISYKLNAFETINFGCYETLTYPDNVLIPLIIEMLKAYRWWDGNGSTLLTADDTIYVNNVLYSSAVSTEYTHAIEYDLSALPSSFLDLVSSNITTISDTLGAYLPMPDNIQYVSSAYYGGKFSIYVRYPAPSSIMSLGYELPISVFAGICAGLIIFAISSSLLIKVPGLQVWGFAAGAILGVIGAVSGAWTIYDFTAGTGTPGTTAPITPAQKIDNEAVLAAKIRAQLAVEYPCAATNTCSVADAAAYNKAIGAIGIVQKSSADTASGTYKQADIDALTAKMNAIDACLSNGTCTPAEALQQIAALTAEVIQNSQQKLAQTTCAEGQTYDVTQAKCIAKASDCWIKGPSVAGVSTGCVLSASTGKTIAVVGGLLIVVYILIKK